MLLAAQVIPQTGAFLSGRIFVDQFTFQWDYVQVRCPVWPCHQGTFCSLSEMGDTYRKSFILS